MSNGKGAIRVAAYDQGYRLGYMEGCAEGDRRTKAIQPDLNGRESVLVLERQCAALRGERDNLVTENAGLLSDLTAVRDSLERVRGMRDNALDRAKSLANTERLTRADMSDLRKELHAQNERVEKLHFAAEQGKVIWERQAAIIREQREQLAKIGELCKS